REEELLYLTLIEDVTNDILRLGIFSNRVLDQLFECYIEENKNRLDEGKMRQLLDVLKSELSCGQESDSELIHSDQGALRLQDLQKGDTTEELNIPSTDQRPREAPKSEEFPETRDSPSK
ncbi:SPAT7 protein, partial [Phainopepla nitens]|nr:SPAT7 protein [Phainopepla nitens]